jgi:hypothetical protein
MSEITKQIQMRSKQFPETYADMLTKFVKLLSDERKLRLQNIELNVSEQIMKHEVFRHMAYAHPILALCVDYLALNLV